MFSDLEDLFFGSSSGEEPKQQMMRQQQKQRPQAPPAPGAIAISDISDDDNNDLNVRMCVSDNDSNARAIIKPYRGCRRRSRAVSPFLDVSQPQLQPNSCFSNCTSLFANTEGVNNHNFHRPPPRDPKTLIDAERVITEELYDMTLEEREEAVHDVHGVAKEVLENPEMIQYHLHLLEQELQLPRYHNHSSSSSASEAFHIAMNQNSEYVRGMYLVFLRCELFDVRQTAERLMKHFDFKRQLWGSEKLGRDITLNDFNAEDRQCLESGFLQILPQRDRAGRAIFVKIWYEQQYKQRENVWRSIWYLEMTIVKDELTQKKGKISILYNVTPNWLETFDRTLFKGVGKLKKATPVRTVAAHYCFTDPAFGAIIKFVSAVMDRKTRTRTKLHQGTHLEVQYDLMSYGLGSILPVSSDGTMRRKDHLKFMKSRQAHEMIMLRNSHFNHHQQPQSTSSGILLPSHMDVLFGRGKLLQMHLGNMKLNHILEEEGRTYFAARREDKARMSYVIVLRMKKEYNTRFLRQLSDKEGGLWIEVDDKIAADKVGHGFRNRKPPTALSSSQAKRNKNDHVASKSTTMDSSAIQQEHTVPKRFRFNGDK